MATATEIKLTKEEDKILKNWISATKTETRMDMRARIILKAAEGEKTKDIARDLGIMPYVVSKWRIRFAKNGIDGLNDTPRPGKPKKYDKATENRILKLLDQPPPKGFSSWNGRLIAEELGDVSGDYVWKVLRTHGIQLQRRHSWCISTDPEFAAKAADIIGLYLDPPENVIVISVDEKPAIQALERAQGWLRLSNGKAITCFNHEYKRHGTTTLFAALEIATGLVKIDHYSRRRRREFLDFMNGIVAPYSEQEIHVILDNLSTHKPKNDRWLARHPNVHFHFTPTHASWLSQIEIWFSLLSRHALKGGSFTSPRQVRQAIDDFTEVHNETASPFEWIKRNVKPVAPKKYYSDLCN